MFTSSQGILSVSCLIKSVLDSPPHLLCSCEENETGIVEDLEYPCSLYGCFSKDDFLGIVLCIYDLNNFEYT